MKNVDKFKREKLLWLSVYVGVDALGGNALCLKLKDHWEARLLGGLSFHDKAHMINCLLNAVKMQEAPLYPFIKIKKKYNFKFKGFIKIFAVYSTFFTQEVTYEARNYIWNHSTQSAQGEGS